MSKINPDDFYNQVRQAYLDKKFKPLSDGNTFSTPNKACALGVFYRLNGGKSFLLDDIKRWMMQQFDMSADDVKEIWMNFDGWNVRNSEWAKVARKLREEFI